MIALLDTHTLVWWVDGSPRPAAGDRASGELRELVGFGD